MATLNNKEVENFLMEIRQTTNETGDNFSRNKLILGAHNIFSRR